MNYNTEKKRKEIYKIDEERKLGSLRSMKADLKVIVGKEGEHREVFWHLRHVLAFQSGYVDALLSTPLPTNDDSNPDDEYTEIVFSDITPSKWKAMMRYLDDPYSMTVEDAYELLPLYDQYDFKTGFKICDGAILQYARFFDYKSVALEDGERLRNGERKKFVPSQVDKCVQIIVMSHEMNLKKTFYWGRVWLRYLFGLGNSMPLKQDHLSELVPIISRDSELREFSTMLPADSYWDYSKVSIYLNGDGEELGLCLKGKMFDFFNHMYTSKGLVNPLAPEVSTLEKEIAHAKHFVKKTLNCIYVKTSHQYEDGAPPSGGPYVLCDLFDFIYRKLSDNSNWTFTKNIQWVLQKDGRTEFVCKNSEYELLPPTCGWVALNVDKKITFEVSYYWKKP